MFRRIQVIATALSADVTAEHLAQVVRDIAVIDVEDGMVFDLDTISVQEKWAAWRRKERLESACEENLDDQITLVASYLDSVFAHGPE
jgi:hypothetical protein